MLMRIGSRDCTQFECSSPFIPSFSLLHSHSCRLFPVRTGSQLLARIRSGKFLFCSSSVLDSRILLWLRPAHCFRHSSAGLCLSACRTGFTPFPMWVHFWRLRVFLFCSSRSG